jgi:hypothetical protein
MTHPQFFAAHRGPRKRNYKVVGYSEPKVRIENRTSCEVMCLIEDAQALKLIVDLLGRIDCDNITKIDTVEDRRFAETMHRSTVALIQSWHRICRLKLRQHLAQ